MRIHRMKIIPGGEMMLTVLYLQFYLFAFGVISSITSMVKQIVIPYANKLIHKNQTVH